MKKRIYRRMPVNDFQPQSISHADLVAVFSMPHIKPQTASLRNFLAGGTSIAAHIPTPSVRKSSIPNIIEVFVGGCTPWWLQNASARDDS